jgi:hypothetical protein
MVQCVYTVVLFETVQIEKNHILDFQTMDSLL